MKISTGLNLLNSNMDEWNLKSRYHVQPHDATSECASKITSNGDNMVSNNTSLVIHKAKRSHPIMEDNVSDSITSHEYSDRSALFEDTPGTSFISNTSTYCQYQEPTVKRGLLESTITKPEILPGHYDFFSGFCCSGEYNCSNCGVWFRKLLHFSIHCKSCYHRSRYICMACLYHTESQKELYCHIQRHDLFHKQCPSCLEWFLDFDIFRNHLQLHRMELETDLENEVIFHCDLQGYNTKEYITWSVTTPIVSKPKYPPPTYLCTACNIYVRSKFRLRVHQSSHKHTQLESKQPIVKIET
jgi:hypothetical protein